MKRFYAHYSKWEANNNGQYLPGVDQDMVNKSIELLCNAEKFYEVSVEVLEEWPISSKVNMTNPSRNKQAWVGQSACCYNHGANEDSTKEAWNLLSEEQRQAANCIADKIITKFKNAQKLS